MREKEGLESKVEIFDFFLNWFATIERVEMDGWAIELLRSL